MRFALCICKDYSKPEIIGGEPTEVYVLLSYGMAINAYDETKTFIHKIGKDVEVFLYCEGYYALEEKGQVCIKRGDPDFWPQKGEGSVCKWENIDLDALKNHSYTDKYAAPGIYIAPKVLDWDPKRLQL